MRLIALLLGVVWAQWAWADLAEHVPGEVIVRLRESRGAPASLLPSVVQRVESVLRDRVVDSMRSFKTDPELKILRLRQDARMGQVLDALKMDRTIAFAEPNSVIHALRVSAESTPEQNWGLRNIHVLPLWDEGVSGSSKVIVAVIDSGIDWTHPALSANSWSNPGETSGNGKDDDGNGFVDDLHGWNFLTGTPDARDDFGHGTHCAGIIGGSDGIGVAKTVSLMSLKTLDSKGVGTLEAAIEAINYARAMGARIISNSWGLSTHSDALEEAIRKARDAGILVVAAAGNDGGNNDLTPTYPASRIDSH